jgi:hypothetical protein
MDRVNGALETLQTLQNESRTLEEKLNYLATRRMSRETATGLFDRLFPVTAKEDENKSESSTRRNNILAAILERYEYCDGGAFPSQRGTAYNMLNAITEWTDHTRSAQGGSKGRAESALFGQGDKLKQSAMAYLMAADMPSIARLTPSQSLEGQQVVESLLATA